jgi:hypothetical protein
MGTRPWSCWRRVLILAMRVRIILLSAITGTHTRVKGRIVVAERLGWAAILPPQPPSASEGDRYTRSIAGPPPSAPKHSHLHRLRPSAAGRVELIAGNRKLFVLRARLL